MNSSEQEPTTRAVLAANISRMIIESSDAAKPSVRAWALTKGLDVRMIDRLIKGEHAVTLDKIDEIARACGLEAWHLLLPNLNYKNPPVSKVTEDDLALLSKLRHLLKAE